MKKYDHFGIRSCPMMSASPIAKMGWSFCMSIAILNAMNPTLASAIVKKSVPMTHERSETTTSETTSLLVSIIPRNFLMQKSAISMNPRKCSKNINVGAGSP